MNRGHLAAMALLLAGCVVTPADSFASAQSAMRRNDLLAALLAYDAVPVSHPRYPEARAGAAAVELRLRHGHELMLEGLVHRGARHDAQALQCLQQARAVWPGLPAVDTLIVATRRRLAQKPAEAPPERSVVAAPPPNTEGVPPTAELAPVGFVDDEVDAAPELTASKIEPADESVVLALVAVEARLGRGELELAVVDLLELARRLPDDVRVQRRLARVLHQRALLRYGQGALTAALVDWERVLSIEPDNKDVADLLRAVRAEASAAAAPSR